MKIDGYVQMRVQNRFFLKQYYHVKVDFLILWTELWPFLKGTFGSDVEVRQTPADFKDGLPQCIFNLLLH